MNRFVLIFFASSVALGATTLHLVRELREERAAGLQLKARVAELERTRAHAPSPPPATPFTVVEHPASPATTPSTSAPPSRAAPAIAASVLPANITKEQRLRMVRESMEQQRALLRDPEYREAMRLQQKAMLPSMYPDLAAELDLTTEQTDALMSLLAEQAIRGMERDRPFFEGQPDPATMQELARDQQELQSAYDNEVRDLLGEDKWRAWNEYRSTMGVRHEVMQMRTTLATTGAPLEESQVKPLQRALLEAQQRQVEEWNRTAANAPVSLDQSARTANQHLGWQEEALRRQRKHYEQLRDSLKTVLTETQLRHVQQQHDAQIKVQEAHLRMMRAQAEAGASGLFAPHADVAVAGEAVMINNGATYVDPVQ
jgi:hypothetical protein